MQTLLIGNQRFEISEDMRAHIEKQLRTQLHQNQPSQWCEFRFTDDYPTHWLVFTNGGTPIIMSTTTGS